MIRSLLIKVDGFESADNFEKFINETNVLLKNSETKRFKLKYGDKFEKSSIVKQT